MTTIANSSQLQNARHPIRDGGHKWNQELKPLKSKDKTLLIILGEDGSLIFSWYEYPHRKKSATLAEDKATRRRINAIFRAVDGRDVTGKALRWLWHYEREGLVVPDGYEYASALNDFISAVVNNRYL